MNLAMIAIAINYFKRNCAINDSINYKQRYKESIELLINTYSPLHCEIAISQIITDYIFNIKYTHF